jgi:hypothetical protein
MTPAPKNTCPYVKQNGEACGNKCFYEFCWQHPEGQKFKPCLAGCGRFTKSKHQYCKCTNKARSIVYKTVQDELNLLLGADMLKILDQ